MWGGLTPENLSGGGCASVSETDQGPGMGMRGTEVTGHRPQPRSGGGPKGSLREWRSSRTQAHRRALGDSEGRVS